ncbi:MAG: hypothetical protein E3J64_01935, partial [Anaerolineales bacterium]
GSVTQADLQAYVDGELSPEREAVLKQHLGTCATCRKQLNRLEEVAVALDTWPLADAAGRLAQRVVARARATPQLPRFRLRWGDALVSGTAAALGYAAVLLWSQLPSDESVAQQAGTVLGWLESVGLHALQFVRTLASDPAVTWGLLSTAIAAIAAASTLPLWYPTLREETLCLLSDLRQ